MAAERAWCVWREIPVILKQWREFSGGRVRGAAAVKLGAWREAGRGDTVECAVSEFSGTRTSPWLRRRCKQTWGMSVRVYVRESLKGERRRRRSGVSGRKAKWESLEAGDVRWRSGQQISRLRDVTWVHHLPYNGS